MNSKQFLQLGGVVLIVVGVLGFIGVIGPEAKDSIFGDDWWFDNGENWAHTLLGVVGVAAGFALKDNLQRPLVLLLGVVGVLFGIYSLFESNFAGTNLENPLDTVLHFAVGAWALFAAMNKRGASMGSAAS